MPNVGPVDVPPNKPPPVEIGNEVAGIDAEPPNPPKVGVLLVEVPNKFVVLVAEDGVPI